MKKSMLILILTALLSGCGVTENTQETAEIPTAQTTQIISFSTTAVTTEITTVSAEITTSECQSEIIVQTTTVTNRQKEKNQENPPNHEQNTEVTTAADNTENTTKSSEASTENTTEKSFGSTQTEASKSTENPPIPTTEPEEYQEEIQTSSTELSESSLSDYEKALAVYNFMTKNGSGTCVQYAYQTYEMCREYGLDCYFIWTENRLYGHVANAVKIGDIWYVLDTQAGCFLTENMCGFTELVDENEDHIADADIISDIRY